jgi:hypothetical protein
LPTRHLDGQRQCIMVSRGAMRLAVARATGRVDLT